jgi:hypothetical protein
MSFKMNKGGGFYIDMRFPEIGRIQRSSWTDDVDTFEGIKVMLKQLYSTGKHDILTGIKKGNNKAIDVYALWSVQKVKNVLTLESAQMAGISLNKWIDDHDHLAFRTKKAYRENIDQLMKFGTDNTTVQMLPELLEKYRSHCKKLGHHRMFNHTRSVLQSYFRDTLGNDHAMWFAIKRIKTFPKEVVRKGNPQSVAAVLALTDRIDPRYGDMVWALCTTGMNWKEYTEDGFDLHDFYVHIKGQKRGGRNRKIPRIGDPIEPQAKYNAFRTRIAKLTTNVRVNDFRRTYIHWMELAGLYRTRRRQYAGHGAGDITDLYEHHEVDAYLKEDGARLSKWIEEQKKSARAAQAEHPTEKSEKLPHQKKTVSSVKPNPLAEKFFS